MITIEAWSDINCPFCYIGKRHLEMAIKSLVPSQDVKVEWKSFELDPYGEPTKGEDNNERLARKYGKDKNWAIEMNRNIAHMAKNCGLDFHMEDIVPANSFNAHRLLHLAKVFGFQDVMQERLMKAKFEEGKDIGDLTVLKDLAFELGLDREEVVRVLESERYGSDVRNDEELAGALGIRGVPFFIINKKHALSGARSVEEFIQTLNEAQDGK